ncbi:MAG: GHKL domain-containing protein [Acutalibacteraceae bacterium]
MLYLYEQNKRCQELGITFEKQVLYDDLSFLSYMDTCTIFANALDNAVKACSEIKEGERKIELFLKRKKDMLNIVIKNTNRIKFWKAIIAFLPPNPIRNIMDLE